MTNLLQRQIDNLTRESKEVSAWIADANFVVFGAILSAYAGVKISQLDDSVWNAFMIIMLCFLHVLFLLSSLIFSAKRSILNIRTKIGFGALTATSMLFAGLVWKATFPTFYIYTGILIGWFLCQFVLSSLIDRVVSTLVTAALSKPGVHWIKNND